MKEPKTRRFTIRSTDHGTETYVQGRAIKTPGGIVYYVARDQFRHALRRLCPTRGACFCSIAPRDQGEDGAALLVASCVPDTANDGAGFVVKPSHYRRAGELVTR